LHPYLSSMAGKQSFLMPWRLRLRRRRRQCVVSGTTPQHLVWCLPQKLGEGRTRHALHSLIRRLDQQI
jgi:hypothetical protein